MPTLTGGDFVFGSADNDGWRTARRVDRDAQSRQDSHQHVSQVLHTPSRAKVS